MGGLMKLALFTSPVLVLVVILVLHNQAEHKADVKVDKAEFKQVWNEMSAGMTRDKTQKLILEQRAADAAKEVEGLKADLNRKAQKVEQNTQQLDNTINSLDSELEKRAK